ncbi:MAG: hypothetical protein AAFV59_07475 [Pseudomonadota bacterium]
MMEIWTKHRLKARSGGKSYETGGLIVAGIIGLVLLANWQGKKSKPEVLPSDPIGIPDYVPAVTDWKEVPVPVEVVAIQEPELARPPSPPPPPPAPVIPDYPQIAPFQPLAIEPLQDWIYPSFNGRTHARLGPSNPYSRRLRQTFERFQGQIRTRGTREEIRDIEWQIYQEMFAYRRSRGLGLGDSGFNMVQAARIVTRWVERNVEEHADIDDEWLTPLETIRRGGDCEDIAVLKYWLLMRLGVPERNLRLVHMDGTSWADRTDRVTHIMLAFVNYDMEWRFLDNGAYLSANRVHRNPEMSDWRIKGTYNRMGGWLHDNYAPPPEEYIFPDVAELCNDRRYRLRAGYLSPAECASGVIAANDGKSLEQWNTWRFWRHTREAYPLGHVGVYYPVDWQHMKLEHMPVLRPEDWPLNARAMSLSQRAPDSATPEEVAYLVRLSLHGAMLALDYDDEDLADGLLQRAQVLRDILTWSRGDALYNFADDEAAIVCDLMELFDIATHQASYSGWTRRFVNGEDRGMVYDMARDDRDLDPLHALKERYEDRQEQITLASLTVGTHQSE